MQCPVCDSDSNVVDSRTSADGSIRRRRVCTSCKRRFTTYERIGSPKLKVIKRSDKTEPFSSDKLLRALTRVCRHRPAISEDDLLRLVRAIEAQLVDAHAKTVRSGDIAKLVLAKLRDLDNLSHDRFAANYLDEAGQLRTEPPVAEAANPQLSLLPDRKPSKK